MVIFNSYVSLPEGTQNALETKPWQRGCFQTETWQQQTSWKAGEISGRRDLVLNVCNITVF